MMKIALVYLSRRGTTEEIARMIASQLEGHTVRLINLDEHPDPDLSDWPAVIIGGPIYIGELPEKLRSYCMANLEELKQKQLGLFVCGMIPDKQKQQEELSKAYPTALSRHARVLSFLGGAFKQERLNWFEKLIVLFIAKTRRSVQQIEHEEIAAFCKAFAG